LSAALGAVVLATIGVGLALQAHAADSLGAPLPPFLMNWAPAVTWPAALAALIGGTLVWLAPPAIERIRAPAVFAAASYVATLGLALSINATRGGGGAWSHVFDLGRHGSFEAWREYLPALPALRHGIGFYIDHFATLLPGLPTHTKGNPPGPLVVMHLLGLTTAGRLAAACILTGALTAPLAYGLGRVLGGERRGRVAAALAVCSPALILFGVTSADYAFTALGTLTALLIVSRSPFARTAGCLLAGVASFFSWLLLAIPVWAVLTILGRDGLRPAVIAAAQVAAGVGAVTLALVLAYGYDPIAVLRALGPVYAHGRAAHRPGAYWVFGSPSAWLVMLGPPTVWLMVRALAAGDRPALALAAVVGISAVSLFTKAETERIWLPFVPLACVAAAALPVSRLRLTLVSLAAQALLVQLLFNTVW
jgi:hypothetical protein